MSIENGFYVECAYNLFLGENELEERLEEAAEEAPFKFIAGMGMALPAFEEQLLGLEEGGAFDFNLSPEKAFGETREDLIVKLDKSIFTTPEGGFDSENIVEGNTIPMRTSEGQTIYGKVNEIADNFVEVDFNHPYAGLTLHFVGKVLAAHVATEEEQAYIYAQMQGGCGGGCNCGNSENEGSCGCGCGNHAESGDGCGCCHH